MNDADWLNQIDRLLNQIQRQDKQALKTLYEISSHKVYAIVLRIVIDRHEAEDVLQEVFIKIWQQAKQYTGSGTAWGWICVLSRHRAIDRQRHLKVHQHDSLDLSPEADSAEIFEQLQSSPEFSDNTHWIGRCLQVLKPNMRQAVLLSYVTGHSHSEISQELSAPLGTVKAWVRRGLQELKQCLAA